MASLPAVLTWQVPVLVWRISNSGRAAEEFTSLINFIVLRTVGEREGEDTVFRVSAEAPCIALSPGGGMRPLRLSGQGGNTKHRLLSLPPSQPADAPRCKHGNLKTCKNHK